MYQGKYEKRPDAPKKAPADTNAVRSDRTASSPVRSTNPVRKRKKRRSGSKKGTVIFYSIYAVCIIAFFIAISCVMEPLKDWLIQYEASQPNHKRDEVFSELFDDPDWAAIYEKAGAKDSLFENSRHYAAYMEQLVGDAELICMETSAGLSGDKKFIVKLGDEKLASFTLTGGSDSQTEIPQWKLGTVEVFFQRTEQVIIQRIPGQTVSVNGIALDDSYRILTTSTVAENYLPEGVHGYRMELLQVTGLLTEPQIKVVNPDGTEAVLVQDATTGIYMQVLSTDMVATEAEKALALNATKAYAEYMIGKNSLWSLQKLFDVNSQFYKTLSKSEIGWVQSGASYAFTEPEYSEFYRYSDTIFSIRLDMTLKQTRFDGSVKDYNLSNTMFFQKNAQGSWLVMEATNVSVQERLTQVRITFLDGEQMISSAMVDANAKTLTLPAVTPPAGKVFSGWVKEETDDAGKTTLTIVYPPAEDNTVYLPSEVVLEPITLHALYEEAK